MCNVKAHASAGARSSAPDEAPFSAPGCIAATADVAPEAAAKPLRFISELPHSTELTSVPARVCLPIIDLDAGTPVPTASLKSMVGMHIRASRIVVQAQCSSLEAMMPALQRSTEARADRAEGQLEGRASLSPISGLAYIQLLRWQLAGCRYGHLACALPVAEQQTPRRTS